MIRGSLHPMSREPAKAEPAPVPLSSTDGQLHTQKKEKFLPVMSRESRFGPGSDHGGGGKSGRRTAPQPRLAPAWREKQLRTEGTAHRLRPAETVHGKGREPGRGGGRRGAFSAVGTPNVARNEERTRHAGRNVSHHSPPLKLFYYKTKMK